MKRQMTVYLLRHGKTPGNSRRAYVGRASDESLSEDGIRELKRIRVEKRSEILRLYERILEKRCKYCVSPMKRCIETGEILFPKITPVVLSGLEEMDFGIFEGKNYKELDNCGEYQSWIDSGGSEKIPKGESREDFIVRTMETFRGAVRSCSAGEMIIVCHGGSIMAILSSLGLGEYFSFQIGNGEGYRIEIEIEEDKIHGISYERLFAGLHT